MFIVLFLMLFLTVCLAWRGKRIGAIYGFVVTIMALLVTEAYFFFQSTTHLMLLL